MEKNANCYDVVIMGGAFSGSSLAILLKRKRPKLKILILERTEKFDFKVGESTSEVAGAFLSLMLHQTTYLSRNHIAKHGLRMWFNSPENTDMEKCSEFGAYYQVRLPTYQVDRSKLDQHLLETAQEEGCEVWRPAKVKDFILGGIGNNSITVEKDGTLHQITAKWFMDASGKAAVIARKRGTLKLLETHPTHSMWARFNNVEDFDGWKVRSKYPEYARALPTPRGNATNHLTGHGWWCWIIPLRSGETSLGLTWDPRLFTPPKDGTIPERILEHVTKHPVGKELFSNAVPVQGDARAYARLPYYSEEVMGDGWGCVGDAAGFMDPLYSQGLDYCGYTVTAAHNVLIKSLDGRCAKMGIQHYNESFSLSYFRWFRSLYQGKYQYLGDAELMWASFLLDLASYFVGPVRLVHENPDKEFAHMPYQGVPGKIFGKFMAYYNKRLNYLARKKWASGKYGLKNTGHRWFLKPGFIPTLASFKILGWGIWAWWKIEFQCLFLPKPPPDEEWDAQKEVTPMPSMSESGSN